MSETARLDLFSSWRLLARLVVVFFSTWREVPRLVLFFSWKEVAMEDTLQYLIS